MTEIEETFSNNIDPDMTEVKRPEGTDSNIANKKFVKVKKGHNKPRDGTVARTFPIAPERKENKRNKGTPANRKITSTFISLGDTDEEQEDFAEHDTDKLAKEFAPSNKPNAFSK